MTILKFIFRADKTNVGDWWSPPFRYFPFKPGLAMDIINPRNNFAQTDTIIIGGGGLGRKSFRPFLNQIKKSNVKKTILWGAGVDTFMDIKNLLRHEKVDLYGDYFNFIDEVGIRVYSSPQQYNYVPCVSCMSNLFFKYRTIKPNHLLGYYFHKDVPFEKTFEKEVSPTATNVGNNLEEKLKFLSNSEYIVTNSYHGVYWATLLERKVICIPFKTGLMSFKYPPAYSFDGHVTSETLNNATCYPDSLEEARKLNVNFYSYLANKYDLV